VESGFWSLLDELAEVNAWIRLKNKITSRSNPELTITRVSIHQGEGGWPLVTAEGVGFRCAVAEAFADVLAVAIGGVTA